MINALKRELAAVTGILAFAARRSRRPGWARVLTLSSLALTVASFKKTFDYRGKNVVITGGSRGLGLSLAWNLLEQGANVTLLAREADELERGRAILWRDFPSAQVYTRPCNVTDSSQLASALEEIVAAMGGIDLWINNAGAILVGPFLALDKSDFSEQIDLHLLSVVEATRRLVPHFQTRGGGRILNICSLGGKVAVPHMLPYDASKFALAGFSQGVTAELAPLGIRVTTAYPTVMRTGSPIQAIFKGDHEKEFAWFQALDAMPGLSLSADTAAKKILGAVADGQTEIILSIPGRARVMLGALLPESMNALMTLATRLLPKGRATDRYTGADSRRLFDESRWLKPLHPPVEHAEEMYNQTPHHVSRRGPH